MKHNVLLNESALKRTTKITNKFWFWSSILISWVENLPLVGGLCSSSWRASQACVHLDCSARSS